jgi:hypothetical protein
MKFFGFVCFGGGRAATFVVKGVRSQWPYFRKDS